MACNLFVIFAFLSFAYSSSGQNFNPTKKQLLSAFKSSIRHDKKTHSYTNAWIICNGDSSFFKSDTIQLINNENYSYYSKKCCDYISWTFSSKNKFTQSVNQVCKEPASAQVLNVNDNYSIQASRSNQILIMTVRNPVNEVRSYKVISIAKIRVGSNEDTATVITLKKIV